MNGWIYGIQNKVTGMIYVGKTKNLSDRFARHKTQLKHGRHRNLHLQNSYKKHGVEQFEYIILETVVADHLPEREQYWIDFYGDAVYNHEKYVLDDRREHNGFFGKHHSNVTRKRMSELKQGVYDGEHNPNYGKQHNSEAKRKMAMNRQSNKLTEADIRAITQLLLDDLPHAKIASMFQVSRTVITRIANGTRWASITGGPVIPVLCEQDKRTFSESHKRRIGDSRRAWSKKHKLNEGEI